MSGTRRRLRSDDQGVSEVIGFLFSFVMAFMILVASMATFDIVSESGDVLAAHAEFQDISNRVAAAVLDAFEIGAALHDTRTQVESGHVDQEPLRYTRSLDVSPDVRGFLYTVEIDARYVYVNATDAQIRANSTTFKADKVLPPPGSCGVNDIVCTVSGSVDTGRDQVVVTYTYQRTPTFVNEITIS